MSHKIEPLFKSDSDWRNNACLNFQQDMSHGYIEGYKRAADTLVNTIIDTGRDQDYLVYPIVFLYRQHIELLLKNTIYLGNKLLGNKSDHPHHHQLNNLWLIVISMTKSIFNEDDSPDFKFVSHVINELCKADPDSFSFRYHKDKDGAKTNSNIVHVNLRHLGETINEVSVILDSIHTAFDFKLDDKNESLSDI